MTDAKVYASAIYAVVAHPQHFRDIFRPLALLALPLHHYTTPHNILLALLVHTNPVSTPVAAILQLATDLCAEWGSAVSPNQSPSSAHVLPIGEHNSPSKGQADPLEPNLEAFLSELISAYSLDDDDSPLSIFLAEESAALEVAHAFLVDTQSRAHHLSFEPSASLVLVLFVKAKCLHTLRYFADVSNLFDSFSALDDKPEYVSWVHGIIRPYDFYLANYKVPNDINTCAGEFLLLNSHSAQFAYLVEPLSRSSAPMEVSAARFLEATALPLAMYYDSDLSELSAWTVANYGGCRLEEFRFWHVLLLLLANYVAYDGRKFSMGSVGLLVRQYAAMCLYFGLQCSTLSPLEYSRVQDQIRATLQYLAQELNVEQAVSSNLLLRSSDLVLSTSFSQFLGSDHPLVATIFDANLDDVLADLLSVVSTCCILFPLNELTIKKYFELKSDASGNWLQKETISILSKVESSSYEQIIKAINGLKESFISDASSAHEIDQVVFERLLQLDMYDKVHLFLQDSTMLSAVTFPLASGRFWELLDNASNLDERIGKLKLCRSCLEIMAQSAASEAQQDQVIRVRHLFKALQNLKNFKLVLRKNQPITPKHILEKLTMVSSEDKFPPVSLIAIILEQNPKSYLAYEKLYKVVNDLAIYLDLDLDDISFPKVQTACVESALIDANFNFAYKHSKELLEYFVESGRPDELTNIWLMFYQVGKYIQADWFNDYDEQVQREKLSVLRRQREILSLAIKHSSPNKGSVDNSRLLVGQCRHINNEISKWYDDAKLHRSDHLNRTVKTTQMQLQENITGILSEASVSKKQAGEKLTNLLTSGLGWAIGATESADRK